MNRWIYSVVLAFVLSSATFAAAWAAKKPEPTPAELAATHGYLRVSIPQWEFAGEFQLTTLSGKKKIYYPDLKDRMGLSSRGGWVPPGEYQISDLMDVDGKPFAPITIRAGEITDLGMLLRVPLGGYEFMVVPLATAESDADGDTVRAALAPVLKSPEVIRWRPNGLPQALKSAGNSSGLGVIVDLISAYERKVNRPPLAKSLKETRDTAAFLTLAKATMPPRTQESGADVQGNLWFGADLGQIRMRDTAGNWSSRDTGTWLEVTAVEPSGNQVVAGNIGAQIITSPDGGATWKLAHALDAGLAILDIDRAGSRWLVLAAPFLEVPPPLNLARGMQRAWTLKDKLVVYSATRDDLADLAPLKEFPMAANWFARWVDLSDVVVGQIVGNTYVVNTLPGIQRLDLATMNWSTAKDPGHRVDSVRFSVDGRVLTAVRNQGAFSKVSTSTDMGETWASRSRPPYTLYDVAFETAVTGEATRWNMNAFSSVLEFHEYDEKVKDWRKAYDSPPGCRTMLRDGSFRQRFCLTNGGSMLVRRDGEWVVEFALE